MSFDSRMAWSQLTSVLKTKAKPKGRFFISNALHVFYRLDRPVVAPPTSNIVLDCDVCFTVD